MVLVLEYYTPKNENRNNEYLFCIRENINRKLFNEINIFVENGSTLPDDITSSGLVKIHNGDRKNIQGLIDFCNESLVGEICFIVNTDIFFDESINLVNERNIEGRFLALTRWNIVAQNKANFFDNQNGISVFSQDTWIFKSPIAIKDANFYMGKPGCDNKLAYLAKQAGLSVRNPSKGLKSYHLHLSNYRTYTPGGKETVPPPYLGIVATNNINRDPEYRWLGKNPEL